MRSQERAIAVVDDDPAVCDSMQLLLEAYNFDVRTYQSGADFLCENPNIACLIVDYRMPGLNGLDFMSEVRTRGNNVPAIMMTALADSAVERPCGRARYQARVTKAPLQPSVAGRDPRGAGLVCSGERAAGRSTGR